MADKKASRLGTGLSALFGEEKNILEDDAEIRTLPIARVEPRRDQPRQDFDPEALVKTFCLPEHIAPVAIFPMGYPAADAKPAGHHDKRLDLAQTTVRHSF